MKTFRQIIESSGNVEHVFSKPIGRNTEVPSEMKKYDSVTKKALIKMVEPVLKHWKMELIDIEPAWWLSTSNGKTDKEIISGEATITVKAYILWKGDVEIGTFFDEEEGKNLVKKVRDTTAEGLLRWDSQLRLKEKTGEMLYLKNIQVLADKANIDFNEDEVKSFSRQCFYREGPKWEKFKKENRGAFSAVKFGFDKE